MSVALLLVNPARTRRRSVDDEIEQELVRRGVEVRRLRPPSVEAIAPAITDALGPADPGGDPAPGPAPAGDAGERPRLLIAGGDGLIHHALPAVAGTGIDVGIVGVGSGNDFARGLGLPSKVGPAVEAALGPTRPLDLIATDDGAYAASVVTAGFSGTVNARANALRFPPGQQRYTVATLLELPRLRPVDLELVVDGTPHHLPASLVAVANTPYFGGGMAICPDADPDDGLLDVTVIGATSALTLGRMLPTVFSGRHVRHPAVTVHRGAKVSVEFDAPWWADGEPFRGQTFTAARSALRVASNLA